MFFDYSTRAGVDHVGIYIGNGKMIAAPQPGESVKVQDVGNPTRHPPGPAPEQTTTAAGGRRGGGGARRRALRRPVQPGRPAVRRRRRRCSPPWPSQESGFNSQAVSAGRRPGPHAVHAGHRQGLGVNPLDPAPAIDGAARYLSTLTKQFGSTDLALAAYNAGPGAVSRYGGIPPYAETQDYVRAVMSKAEAYR